MGRKRATRKQKKLVPYQNPKKFDCLCCGSKDSVDVKM